MDGRGRMDKRTGTGGRGWTDGNMDRQGWTDRSRLSTHHPRHRWHETSHWDNSSAEMTAVLSLCMAVLLMHTITDMTVARPKSTLSHNSSKPLKRHWHWNYREGRLVPIFHNHLATADLVRLLEDVGRR
ncbi:hypothetical protein LSAT2_006743 [Lamellibrachia satsuma]|nr:hypothetical protein LSAT2_006743 [Lamellibrachia satsuma]